MTSNEIISKLVSTYGKAKSDAALEEYRRYFQRFTEKELDIFWDYFVENYEYSVFPAIGKLEKARRDCCREQIAIGSKVDNVGGRAITPENIESFSIPVQLEYAKYWLSLTVPDTDRYKTMLYIIAKCTDQESADAEDQRMRENHKDHEHCKFYTHCVNGLAKKRASKPAQEIVKEIFK